MFETVRAGLAAALIACATFPVAAQETQAVRGTVIDDATGETLRGAVIVVDQLDPQIAVNGTFELLLDPGDHVIVITAQGYLESTVDVTVEAATVDLEIRMRRLFLSEEVSVVAEAEESARPSSVTVQPRDVFDVAGSLDNVFRTLQLLPGVAAPEDFGGRLSVRGGGPDQNLTVMDGVEVHNPYRIFGLISAFNPETVDRFDLTAGGFSAAYGDRLSSLLVVENRRGRPAFGGMAAMSVTDANVLVEGSLPGRAGNSYVFTARRTYYDLVASRFSDNDFPNFRDFQGRFDLGVGPGVLTVQGITSREGADISIDDEESGDNADAISDASNDLVSLRYRTLLGARGSSLTTLSWYRNTDLLDFAGAFQADARRSNVPEGGFGVANVIFAREVLVEDFAARQQFSYSIGRNHLLDFGFEVHRIKSATRFKTEGDRNNQEPNGSSIRGGVGLPDELDSTLSGTRGGIWLEDTINLGSRVAISPGLRFDWNTANGDSTLGPRLAVFWQAADRTRLKLAGGLFTQSPGYEKLQSADYFIDLSDAKARGIASQYATHAIVGVEHGFGGGFTLSVEAYYKKFRDLIIGRLETEQERLARVSQYDFPEELQDSVPTAPIITSNPSNEGSGATYGVDFFLMRRPTGPTGLYGWLSYTLGKSEQDAYGRRYAFDYDRRHALNLVANYRFSSKWELGVTGRYSTGFPRTEPIGLRVAATEDPDHDPDDPNPPKLVPETDASGNLVYTVDYGDTSNLNGGRLPSYARWDARVTYRPGGPAGSWEVYLEVLNVLGRENASRLEPALLYNPMGPEPLLVENPDAALPRLPSFGVRFRF